MLSRKNKYLLRTGLLQNFYFGAMKFSLRNLIALSIIPQILLVQWAASAPGWVEQYYSTGLYPYISQGLRFLYGWVPFSIGDLCYTVLGILSLVYVFKGIGQLRTKPLAVLRNVLVVVSIAYFSFNLLWGLNYHRLPLASHMNLDTRYTQAELLSFANTLVKEVNAEQTDLTGSPSVAVTYPFDREQAQAMSIAGFRNLKDLHQDFSYRQPSLKNSMYSTMLSFMGYGGYLNPFTNEAQVNGRLPLFRYTVVCGHEIGHQLGYSKENETNFIGYLVALHHPDPHFRYAAKAYALAYTLGEVRRRDTKSFEALYDELNPGVRENYAELESFWKSFANPAEPVFKSAFNQFLKANNQKDGIRSYNKVVGLMLAYHRG